MPNLAPIKLKAFGLAAKQPIAHPNLSGVKMAERQQRRIQTRRIASAEPVPAHEWKAAQEMLAKLVARAYAADHPELFTRSKDGQHEHKA